MNISEYISAVKIKYLSLVFIVSAVFCCTAVQNASAYIEPEDEMLNFGIIAEKIDTSRTVTFAEYSAMIMRSIGCSDMLVPNEGDKWYSASMKSAEELGFYTVFSKAVDAEKNIKAKYALEMTAAALGYGAVIKQTEDAWYTEAIRLGLSKGVNVSGDDELTREDAYIILHNALSTNLCVMNGRGYSISRDTLEDRLLKLRDSEYLLGIVEASYEASISGGCTEKGEVRIGGELFKAGDIDVSDYLGSYVRFFIKVNADGYKEIKWIEPHKNNKTIYLGENSGKNIKNGRLYYYDEDNKSKNLQLSDGLITLYNNRPTPRLLDEVMTDEARIKLTDNNGDGRYDIAEVTEIESYVVKNIYPQQGQIIFEYATDGKKRLDTVYTSVYDYYDKDGNPIDISDIKSGDALSVISDENGEYVQIYKTEAPFEGAASAKGNKKVTVNSEEYRYIGDSSIVTVGEKSTFCKDLWGQIFYARKEFDSYIYIRKIYEGEVPDSVYIDTFDGAEFNTYKISSSVSINGMRKKTADDIIGAVNVKTLASISLNSSDEVSKIELADEYAKRGYRTYCENDFGFVDYEDKVLKPFACDTNRTKIFFVPVTDKKEDYFNIFELDNDEDYMVTGFDYDSRINRVRAVLVEMDPEEPLRSGFSKSSEFMAVNEISTAITDDDEAVYVAEGICGGEEITIAASQRQSVFNELSTVDKGDVIQFVRNMNGEIGLVRKVMDFSELGGYYYDDSDYRSIELYAPASEVNRDVMTNVKKYLVNEIKCRVDGRDISSCVSASEKSVPNTDNKGFNNYFLYSDGGYEKGNIDSVIDSYGELGSDLYIWSNNDDVKFVTIINK